jgi:hypothetical protein
MNKRNRFPAGWNQDRVSQLLRHYEEQTQDETVAEDEAAFRKRGQTVMVVPRGLVPAITKLIKREEKAALTGRPSFRLERTRKKRRGAQVER